MILIVGLGNIGEQYSNTKHNVGFMAIDKIANDHNFPDFKEKKNYLFTKSKVENEDIILIKPTTYMNLSGEAVQSASTMYKIKPEDIIVIHDDLDIPTSEIRTKIGGSAGGHNGLKSIDNSMRIRLHYQLGNILYFITGYYGVQQTYRSPTVSTDAIHSG